MATYMCFRTYAQGDARPLLERVSPSDDDSLSALGDTTTVARPPWACSGVRRGLSNATVLMGNHEDSMLSFLEAPDEGMNQVNWDINGGISTREGLAALPRARRTSTSWTGWPTAVRVHLCCRAPLRDGARGRAPRVKFEHGAGRDPSARGRARGGHGLERRRPALPWRRRARRTCCASARGLRGAHRLVNEAGRGPSWLVGHTPTPYLRGMADFRTGFPRGRNGPAVRSRWAPARETAALPTAGTSTAEPRAARALATCSCCGWTTGSRRTSPCARASEPGVRTEPQAGGRAHARGLCRWRPCLTGGAACSSCDDAEPRASREVGYHYGNPQNRFWRVMAVLWGEEPPAGARPAATWRCDATLRWTTCSRAARLRVRARPRSRTPSPTTCALACSTTLPYARFSGVPAPRRTACTRGRSSPRRGRGDAPLHEPGKRELEPGALVEAYRVMPSYLQD